MIQPEEGRSARRRRHCRSYHVVGAIPSWFRLFFEEKRRLFRISSLYCGLVGLLTVQFPTACLLKRHCPGVSCAAPDKYTRGDPSFWRSFYTVHVRHDGRSRRRNDERSAPAKRARNTKANTR
jgi:hypothetical protein